MTATQQTTVSFRTTLVGSGGKAGIVVPDDVVEALGAGRRPAVHVELDGHAYRSTVGVMGGRCMVPVNASVRAATGLEPGRTVDVTLTLATTPREVVVPPDLAAALAADPSARAFFDGLANSLQRFHVDTVEAAKTDQTRARRVDKAVALFREGRKR